MQQGFYREDFGKCACLEDTSWFCEDCDQFICTVCQVSHATNVFTRDHSPLACGRIVLYVERCKVHTKKCKRYCEQCAVLYCKECTKHRDHPSNTTNRQYLQNKNKIMDEINSAYCVPTKELENKITNYKEEIKILEQKIELAKQLKKGTTEEINKIPNHDYIYGDIASIVKKVTENVTNTR